MHFAVNWPAVLGHLLPVQHDGVATNCASVYHFVYCEPSSGWTGRHHNTIFLSRRRAPRGRPEALKVPDLKELGDGSP